MTETAKTRAGGRAMRAAVLAGTLALITAAGVRGTQDAVANGDTRTISILHEHTKESATVTFKRNGVYDADALKQLSWLLRDWRLDEPTRMQPKLFDIVWEVYREVGAQDPIRVVSAYRSPKTNAMLRRRSKAVAEHSQHMRGYAMDFYLPDVSMARVREVGMRLQEGGVGFYPNAFNPFVHLDAGSVRSWPRMPAAQLARLFPDGRTVHIPREGRPLGGYEDAKAEILARGGSVAGYSTYAEADADSGSGRKSLWAMLFGGGGDDEDTEFYRQPTNGGRAAAAGRTRVASAAPPQPDAFSAGNSEDGGARSFFAPAPAATAPARPVRIVSTSPPPMALATSPQAGPSSAAGDEPMPITPPLASATPDDIRRPTFVPVPPRRPVDLPDAVPLLLASVPLPPTRPATATATATSGSAQQAVNGQMRLSAEPARRIASPAALLPSDEKAVLRSLFDAASTAGLPGRQGNAEGGRALSDGARTAFSASERGDLRADRFSGSAVAPTTTLR